MKELIAQARQMFLKDIEEEYGVNARDFCERHISTFVSTYQTVILTPKPATLFSEYVLRSMAEQNAAYTKVVGELCKIDRRMVFVLLEETRGFVNDVASLKFMKEGSPAEEVENAADKTEVLQWSTKEFINFLERAIASVEGKSHAPKTPAA